MSISLYPFFPFSRFLSAQVTLCGYRCIHWYIYYSISRRSVLFFSDSKISNQNRFEKFVWIPNVIAFPVLLGVAGKHLNPSTFLAVPAASAAQIISFGSVVASAVISWSPFAPDYGVYHNAEAST